MKTTLFILGMIFMGVTLYAQTSKKEYQKSFDKAGITEVVLSNRYGQIDVEQKKADKIDVTATISVTAKNRIYPYRGCRERGLFECGDYFRERCVF